MMGKVWTHLSSQLTADTLAYLSLTGCVFLGGILSATADNAQDRMEGIAVGVAALSYVFFMWGLACAAQGNYPKAAKRFIGAGALGVLSYGIVEVSRADTYQLVEEKPCGKGLTVPRAAIRKLQQAIPELDLHGHAHHQDILWISSGNTKVFSLTEQFPDLVFKMGENSEMTCQHMSTGVDVIARRHLDLLYVPPATKLTFSWKGRSMSLIVQQRHHANADPNVQENLYREYGGRMHAVIRQMVTFIEETGFSDVKPTNVLLRQTGSAAQPLQVILHDLDEMSSAARGIIGVESLNLTPLREGLIGCLFKEEDIDLMLSEARKNGLFLCPWDVHKAKERRLKRIH
jgi:hypothetical protein